jgi:hypothetical protein
MCFQNLASKLPFSLAAHELIEKLQPLLWPVVRQHLPKLPEEDL